MKKRVFFVTWIISIIAVLAAISTLWKEVSVDAKKNEDEKFEGRDFGGRDFGGRNVEGRDVEGREISN